MCPSRNPCATAAATLALLLFAALPARAGTPAVRGCAKPSGDCSGQKLWGKHYWKMDLTRSRWVRSRLLLASFRFSDLYSATFRRASLRRADLSFGNRTRADFRDADLTRANLSHADFYGSTFRGADLRGARLVGSRFDHANLARANFEGAVLVGSSFVDIRLCHTIQPNGEERNDDCGGRGSGGVGAGVCCFPGADPTQGAAGGKGGKGDGDVLVGDL